MNQLFIALTQNTALLITLSVLYGLLSRFRSGSLIRFKILAGLLFGLIAIAGMLVPVSVQSGIFYDGRSIVLLLSGLFGGGLAAAIAMILTGAFRVYLGGTGMFAGVLTIMLCPLVGVLARRLFQHKPGEISMFNLWIISLVAHLLMLLSQLAIPWPSALEIISEIWLPVLTVFPLATLIIAILMQTEERRLQALDSIRRSEKRYQTLSEKSPVGIFRTRPDGYTTYVNPRWSQITGLSFDDALGNGWLEAVHPDDKIKLLDGWNQATDRQEKSIAEYRFLKSNREVVWVFGEAVADVSETGEVLGYIGTITDITQRKLAEQALGESELNYRHLFENDSAVKLMTAPATGQIIQANLAASEFYGWTVDELKSMNINQIKIETPANGSAAPENSLDEQGNFYEEEQHQLANGKTRHVEVFTSKIRFQGQDCFHSIIHDVTGRRKAEEKLRLLGKALEQSPVSITISDREGLVEYVNPKFSEITGYRFDEVIGTNSDILNSREHANVLSRSIWDTITSGRDWIGEVENQRKNGERYWESLIISPIFDPAGQITNFISIKEDITERKQMIRDVIVAKEKAEEAEHLKSAFLANMSHEIRTPLNAILGFTTLLTTSKAITDETRESYMAIINKSAEGLLRIINDILDISKLETGQVKIYKQEFRINPVLESLYVQYQNKLTEAGKSGIELIQLPPPGDLEMVSDKDRLTQILSNLLDNACKFTESGTITFGVAQVLNGQVELMVSDTGIGIRKKDQSSIFERFRQVGQSSVRINSGNGLGLAIAKSLVELMDGQIEFESVLDEGTSFRIRFPLK
ncbi:PAS domain S-box protein [Sunxiuqinia dokdonensis]|uniref:PAS domain S-box protein n=1 Tax=Sunxiuqinia dokdonensis TaxID=1409788 RepID=UPI00069ED5A0|nr:PAS domain S-box protein [Sunxiuqinia dokdonensis]